MASLCYRAMGVAGLTGLARRMRRGGLILCYHNVVAEAVTGPWDRLGLHLPLPAFERQMRWLARHYEVVSLAEFVGRVRRGRSLHATAAVTFDDGYTGVFEHAWPVLRGLGLPATAFVVADAPGGDGAFWWDDAAVLRAYAPARHQRWLTALRGDGAAILASLASGRAAAPASLLPPWRRPASWDTIAGAVRSGLRLGAHSATHRSLTTLDDLDLRREVVASREAIGRHTGVTPDVFAYPYGLWNDHVRRAVRSAGYRAAFTLGGGTAAGADLWALPRLNVPARIEDAAFRAWTAGLSLRRPA